jgi:hypothetical protein
VTVSSRSIAAALVGVVLLALLMAVVTVDSATVWMLRVAFSSCAIAFVPGALIVLAWHPRRSFDVLEWAAFSLAVSFGVNELLTIAALLGHWSPLASLVILGVLVVACAARAWRRDTVIEAGADHLAIIGVLAVLAAFLYAAGSGYDNVEDRIHIAIIERLAHLARPSFRNIYFSPGVVYTYPFPGTHYMLALMARLGGIPAIFVYVKLRAFWGVAAIVVLYGCALLIFESRRIALASTLVVAGLVANGAFGAIPGMYWGQMAPFSHAGDVAMGVLLPTLLFLMCEVLRARERGEMWFALLATMTLTLMLVIVHIREIAQFAVYLAAFALVLVLARGPRPLVVRAIGLLLATAALVVAYRAWNAWAVPLVDALVEGHRRDLRDLYHSATWPELFGQPYPLMRNYMPVFQPFYYGWNPLVLLASPAILFAFRDKRLSWLIAASVTCYLLIIRYPAFAIPYTYATYFEILYTPVRNVVFFVYLLAGVGLYILAAMLSRLAYIWLIPLAAICGFAILEAMRHLTPVVSRQVDFLFVPLLAGYALYLLILIATGRRQPSHAVLMNPRPRWIVALLIMFAFPLYDTRIQDTALISRHWQNRISTPSVLMASIGCRDHIDCPPPPALIRLAHTEIPAESLFAVDLNEDNQPALFMPQQMVVWTGGTDTLLEPETIFPRYFQYLKLARDAGADQPLFNTSEPRERREAFLRDLSVTHVLLDPVLYEKMKPVFDADTDLLTSRYDDGRWALYEVRHR